MIYYYILWGGIVIIPIALVIAWYGCIKRYLYLEFKALGEQNNITRRIWYYLSIALMVFIGKASFCSTIEVVDYLTNNWNLLDGLHDCIAIKAGICIGWILCWIGCILLRKTISAKGKIIKKSVILTVGILSVFLLVRITENKESYIYHRTEDVWFEKMADYCEEYGISGDVEPFSRN